MAFKIEFKQFIDESIPSYWFIFRDNLLLVELLDDSALIPFTSDLTDFKLSLQAQTPLYFGSFENIPCYFIEISNDFEFSEKMSFQDIRSLYGRLNEDLLWVAGRAFQLMIWDKNSQYCGQCGTPTEIKFDERAKKCPACSLLSFPRISPAIIVGIIDQKQKRILLANGTRFPSNFYSVIAGFVEPGETLEECIRREIFEEVGIEIENIRYFNSQSWPFPDSLMIGFLADYAKGQISIDKSEINDAQWFSADNLPRIPGKISIARKIIDWFVENY
ncbi:MAG: NAD(+) diphosphatase [Candidatus Hodarchaeales archaeon]|jgi:NAD+ diphosphatase